MPPEKLGASRSTGARCTPPEYRKVGSLLKSVSTVENKTVDVRLREH